MILFFASNTFCIDLWARQPEKQYSGNLERLQGTHLSLPLPVKSSATASETATATATATAIATATAAAATAAASAAAAATTSTYFKHAAFIVWSQGTGKFISITSLLAQKKTMKKYFCLFRKICQTQQIGK